MNSGAWELVPQLPAIQSTFTPTTMRPRQSTLRTQMLQATLHRKLNWFRITIRWGTCLSALLDSTPLMRIVLPLKVRMDQALVLTLWPAPTRWAIFDFSLQAAHLSACALIRPATSA